MLRRALRQLLIVIVVVAIFAAVGYYIYIQTTGDTLENYNLQVTVAVETAIARALFGATSTAEAPLAQYRVVLLGPDDTLSSIAEQYNTTVEVLRMANSLALNVESGPGTELIVPEGVQVLEPARRLRQHRVVPGDTLSFLAERNGIPLELLERDNPVLAQRELNPGDIVFIPTLL